jgi:hypothetical protein
MLRVSIGRFLKKSSPACVMQCLHPESDVVIGALRFRWHEHKP